MIQSFFKVLSRGKLTVLLFHKVPLNRNLLTPYEMDLSSFEKVLLLVNQIFRVIPLDDAVLALRAGNLPERAACITFDDGYPDWMLGAVPVLERHRLHATFFITTGQFDGLPMWNERILHAVASAPATVPMLEMAGSGLGAMTLGGPEVRAQVIKRLDHHLKYLDPEQRENQICALEQWAGVTPTGVPVMSAEELRALHAKGFGIGSHTVAHPILNRCTPAHVLHELVQAREQLESLICGRVNAFAYPNGVPEKDFRAEHIELVKQAGYACAVTTHRGAATSSTSVFQIPRFTPWGPTPARMKLQLARNLMQPPKELPEPDPEPGKKRALMVAFHFPPQAGSSGILRTLNFVKNLPQSGWTATVLTANPRAYTEQRNDLVSAIPLRTKVLRAFALDAARHLSIAHKYPAAIALPDRWVSWWPRAVVLGMSHIRRQRPDLIWSTYPIATAHLIGGSLARLSGLPWVADFRDPMVSPDFPSHPLQRKVWKRLEAHVLRHATACVFTTRRAADTYAERYPHAAGKCHVIENGYDEDAFLGVPADRCGTPADTLLLLHSGLIYPKDRNPSTFFAAVQDLLQSGQLDRKRLLIRFRAPHHEAEVKAYAAIYGLEDVVDIAPPVPYRDAIAEMMGADLLLVFQGSYFNAQIPAKIYEYLRAARPVFAVLDPQGDTATQLSKFPAVQLADIASSQAIKIALSAALESMTQPGLTRALERNRELVQPFSRRAQAVRLVQHLDAIAP